MCAFFTEGRLLYLVDTREGNRRSSSTLQEMDTAPLKSTIFRAAL